MKDSSNKLQAGQRGTAGGDHGNQDLILVTGGTGKIGRRIVERLEAAGNRVRVASRRADPAFDWDDSSTWDRALDGVTAAFISVAPDLAIPGTCDKIQAFTNLAVAHGVERLVLLSGRGEDEAQACERIVRDSGVDWTVVRCAWFNQNFSEGEFLEMVQAGAVTLPGGDTPEPFVDCEDIADVATAALTEDRHSGEIYELTGPELLTLSEAVAEIAAACGRDVEYVQLPHEAFVGALTESGAPQDMVWLLDYLFATILDGRNSHLCNGVERALGRKPRDFADYARRTAATGIWNAAIEAKVA